MQRVFGEGHAVHQLRFDVSCKQACWRCFVMNISPLMSALAASVPLFFCRSNNLGTASMESETGCKKAWNRALFVLSCPGVRRAKVGPFLMGVALSSSVCWY